MIIRSGSLMKSRGFTIIELLVVVVIIGVLASIGTISYGDYQKNLTISQLKSDLNGVSSVMENARTFDNAYPASVPATFTPTQTVTLSGGSYDGGKTYCVDSTSSKDLSLHYYIDSINSLQGAQIGTCAFAHPAPENLVAAKATNTLLNVSWDAVPGATSYTLQRDTVETFSSGSLTTVSQAGTTTPSTVLQGVNYYYRVNATLPDMTSGWSDVINANTNIDPPTAPVLVASLNGANAQATVSPASSCGTGTVQYGFRSRTNDGSWSGYSSWSTTSTSSLSATQGVKYGFQAQARCYVDATLFGSSATGVEATYIHPITSVPATPVVTASAPNWATTTYSWGAPSCAAGSSARYQYYFSTSYGYNSGWVAIGSGSISLTTSSSGYTYTLQAQSQCYSPYASGPWSATGSASYYRPYTVTVLVVAGGGAGGAGDSYGNGGGGGAGGYIYTGYNVSPGGWGVTVGGGGSRNLGDSSGSHPGQGSNGGNSAFGPLVAIGGGGGGGAADGQSGHGSAGGSGGGAPGSSSSNKAGGGYTAGQGNVGGNACTAAGRPAGGGGGATGGNTYFNGGCSVGSRAGDGGTGITLDISGSSVCYAGGGGGGIGGGTEGFGSCGGGNAHETQNGDPAAANTGSGGGGGKTYGGNGGSGIVIVRYNYATMNADGGSKYASGSDYVHVFTGSGTLTVY